MTGILPAILSFTARNWPFENGVGRLIDWCGGGIDLGNGSRDCQTKAGFTITVMENDLIGRHLILSGQFDSSLFSLLRLFSDRGDVCVDIGANIGYMSCMMLAQVPESRIIAIEPQQEIVDFLRRNLKRFSSERWEVIEAGLSDRDGVGAMQTSIANRGAARLISEPTPSSQQVRLLEASTFFGALPRVDLIKMDVEGHEETVLRSASATIKRLQPKAILFEDQLGQAAPDGRIGVILEDCGYTVFGVHKSLLSTKIIPLQRKDRPRFNDYLAVSRSRRLPRSAIERYGLVASANG